MKGSFTMELVKELMNYYRENVEDFNNDIEELNNWNGCLYDDQIYPMEDINDVYCATEPEEILRRAFYGYDEPGNEDDQRQPFNPNREYFYFNGFGNLVSTDEKDYSDYLDKYFIQDIIDNSYNLTLSEGAQNLIDNYEDEN